MAKTDSSYIEMSLSNADSASTYGKSYLYTAEAEGCAEERIGTVADGTANSGGAYFAWLRSGLVSDCAGTIDSLAGRFVNADVGTGGIKLMAYDNLNSDPNTLLVVTDTLYNPSAEAAVPRNPKRRATDRGSFPRASRRNMAKAPGKVIPRDTSYSLSAHMASASVTWDVGRLVIFSAPVDRTVSYTPDPTAIMPCMTARAPDAHAASTLVDGILLRPR